MSDPEPPAPAPENLVINEKQSVENTPILTTYASHAATLDKSYLTTTKLYEGDLVIFRNGFHQNRDLSPSYGKILHWGHPLTSNMRKEQKIKDGDQDLVENGEKCIVQWETTLMLQLVNRTDLSLVDRSLRRGQAVQGQGGMNGIVKDTETRLTLEIIGSKSVIEDVPRHRIYSFENVIRGQEILYRGWAGVVTSVQRNLNFRVGTGGTVSIPMNENDGFMAYDPYWLPGSYYPGHRVQLDSSLLKKGKIYDAMFKSMFWKFPIISDIFALDSFTVLTPHILGITVHWLCKNPFDEKASDEPPPESLNSQMLTEVTPIGMPSCETMNNLSIRQYTLLPRDTVKNYGSWVKAFSNRYMDVKKFGHSGAPENPLKRGNKGMVVRVRVLLPQTRVIVEWADGQTETLSAASIPYIAPLKEEMLCKAGLVVSKVFPGLPQSYKRYGVVTNQAADYKMANVRWLVITADCPGHGAVQDLGITEESIYDVKPHEEYSLYQKGTVVFVRSGAVKGLYGGAVVDLDLNQGQMLIATPGRQRASPVWPHMVKALPKRASWNFFTKSWSVQQLIPPSYQIDIDKEKPTAESEPIRLSVSNNNILENLDTSLKNEPPRFETLEAVPPTHFYKSYADWSPQLNLKRTGFGEAKELLNNLPEGIWVRAYEDRLDLLSILFLGPNDTPYEDGLYMFDVYLPSSYPEYPPLIKYISYNGEISPVVDHQDGEFCTACLNWDTINQEAPSIILQTVERVQSALFHREPYFDVYNIPVDTSPENVERSRAYNEKIFIGVLSSLYSMMQKPHAPWRDLISTQMFVMLQHKLKFLKGLLAKGAEAFGDRTYALFPVSKAFYKSLTYRIEKFEELTVKSEEKPSTSKVLFPETEESVVSLKVKHTVSKIQIQDIDVSESKSDMSAIANANEILVKETLSNQSAFRQGFKSSESGEFKILKKASTDENMNIGKKADAEADAEDD